MPKFKASGAEKNQNVKKRHWAFVIYPDSAPADWIEQLKQSGLRCAISPLHDKDTNADEHEKKPHWHVIACWEGPTAFSVVKALTDRLNAPKPMALESVKGYYRYLTHKDNPEKYQYDEADIVYLNGFDPADYIEWTRSELEAYKRDVFRLIRERNLLEYADLLDQLMDEGRNDLLSTAANNTILFRSYIASRRHRLIPSEYRINTETGEIIKGDNTL